MQKQYLAEKPQYRPIWDRGDRSLFPVSHLHFLRVLKGYSDVLRTSGIRVLKVKHLRLKLLL